MDCSQWLILCATALMFLVARVTGNDVGDGDIGDDIYLEWNVSFNSTIRPVNVDQQVITINGMFPGPLLNASTNDRIHVNIFNNLDEPFLMTWSGIQQRLNSWQDGVSGTNCPIEPGKNWTHLFKLKDQIGSFVYFPSTRFQKAAGGFGPIRINNRAGVPIPFDQPDDEFDLLIGDWYNTSYKDSRRTAGQKNKSPSFPPYILFNGKPSYNNSWGGRHESFTLKKGNTYKFRVSNVGRELSLNFRIQNHQMVLVETEGSYINKMVLNSLDVHVGQSYTVLVTANQSSADYYIVATPTQVDTKDFSDTKGVGILHYDCSTTPASGPLPIGPNPLDSNFSVEQARSIRWNLKAGAATINPQGSFNVSNVTITQTFILYGSKGNIGNNPYYLVNNVSYLTPETPLKLADHYLNGTGVYHLDAFPVHSINVEASRNTSVVSGIHKSWVEIVLINDLDVMDTWRLSGFGLFTIAYGFGEWKHGLNYNLYDPVVRSTIQVYPKGWSVIYAYLDNPGMWSLHSQTLENWYLGQEIYVRVYDPEPNPAKEKPPPDNLLYCGKISSPPVAPPSPSPRPSPSPKLPPSPSPSLPPSPLPPPSPSLPPSPFPSPRPSPLPSPSPKLPPWPKLPPSPSPSPKLPPSPSPSLPPSPLPPPSPSPSLLPPSPSPSLPPSPSLTLPPLLPSPSLPPPPSPSLPSPPQSPWSPPPPPVNSSGYGNLASANTLLISLLIIILSKFL